MIDRHLELVTAPPAEPITVAEAKAQLRVDHSDDDTLIGELVQAAREYLEAATNRAFVEQTWDLKLDDFPTGSLWRGRDSVLRLPKPPLRSVTSVTYLDAAGDSQTLATTVYQVIAPSGPRAQHGHLSLKYGQTWPSTRQLERAVTVRFVAGYAPSGGSPEDYRANIPEALRHAVKLLVTHWYENRGHVVVGMTSKPLEDTLDALLAQHKVGWIV